MPAAKCDIRTRAGADEIASALETAGVRTARLSVGDLNRFPTVRRLALDGIQAVVARGRLSDDALARARAAENRVFVIIAVDTVQSVIDPDGVVAWRAADGGEHYALDASAADMKQFTPETDLWAQRRVGCYRLDSPVAAGR